MGKVVVKDIEFVDALRKFNHITSETRKTAKHHEFYLRPGLKAKAKKEEAKKTNAKCNAKKRHKEFGKAPHTPSTPGL
ncbi:MAG: 30S ribosomal protein S21 [Mycoplasmataceae bacterium]|jgi:small subunit ribosomal protein S21|nr:30S ribosomal protein S21 [Mycoplasmataceae bacterium]